MEKRPKVLLKPLANKVKLDKPVDSTQPYSNKLKDQWNNETRGCLNSRFGPRFFPPQKKINFKKVHQLVYVNFFYSPLRHQKKSDPFIFDNVKFSGDSLSAGIPFPVLADLMLHVDNGPSLSSFPFIIFSFRFFFCARLVFF